MQSTVNDHYKIEIPNEKAATYKVVTFIIALINIAAFCYIYFNETNQAKLRFAILGAILSVTAFVFYIIQNKTKNLQTFKIEISFIILAVIWFMCGDYWLALPMLLFGVLGTFTNKPILLRFDQAGMLYPSFPARFYRWEEIDFVLLKDGILTIEMKNNRISQFTLSKQETGRVDENIFNKFCSTRINTNPV